MRRAASVMAVALMFACAVARAATTDGYGEVSFASSGAPAAQPAFLRGLALLHDFEYEDAAASFQEAERLDPGFALAYWGEAMTHTHPVWMEQDFDAGRAALAKLAPIASQRLAKAPTERERDYLAAVDRLYGEGTKEARDVAYADAMGALHERYPDDVDATAFYALALLGTAHQGRDFATYMRAAALLEAVLPTHPHHPGVLHYLIHCYDDAVHAPLGLRPASVYGAVAANAGHALHMTSHIFIALGQWDDVIDANERAMAVVDRHRAAKGLPPRHCGHYANWLHYAYLQTGREEDADHLRGECARDAAVEIAAAPAAPGAAHSHDSLAGSVDGWAEMRLQRIVDGGEAPGTPVSVPAGRFPQAREALAYGDALVAAAHRDVARTREAATRLAAVQHELEAPPAPGMAPARSAAEHAVLRQQVDALVLLAARKVDEAAAALRTVATAEDALPLAFGPPAVEKPSRELLGELLMGAGHAGDAIAELEAVLARAPGRTGTLDSLSRAQRSTNHVAEAQRSAAQVERNRHRRQPGEEPKTAHPAAASPAALLPPSSPPSP